MNHRNSGGRGLVIGLLGVRESSTYDTNMMSCRPAEGWPNKQSAVMHNMGIINMGIHLKGMW